LLVTLLLGKANVIKKKVSEFGAGEEEKNPPPLPSSPNTSPDHGLVKSMATQVLARGGRHPLAPKT